MLKTLIDAIIVLMLVGLVFSPAIVLRGIDKYFFHKKNVTLFYRDIFDEPLTNVDMYEGESTFNQDVTVERDEKILQNLKAMVKNTRKRKAKKMWMLKLGEYQRKLKWMTTMEKAKGHETLPVT